MVVKKNPHPPDVPEVVVMMTLPRQGKRHAHGNAKTYIQAVYKLS